MSARQPNVAYRELTGTDAAAVCALRASGLVSDPGAFSVSADEERRQPVAALEAALSAYRQAPDRAVFGAFDTTLVGMIGVERLQGALVRHKARLWGLCVATEQRRRGIATQLISRSLAFVESVGGIETVLLEVSSEAAAARRLYELQGFSIFATEVGAMKRQGIYVDEYRMRRPMPAR